MVGWSEAEPIAIAPYWLKNDGFAFTPLIPHLQEQAAAKARIYWRENCLLKKATLTSRIPSPSKQAGVLLEKRMTPAKPQTKQSYPNSLLKRFRKTIGWLYLASIIISIPIVYFLTQHQAYSEANKELTLLVDSVKSLREYISKDVRPGLLKANLFDSPAISSTVSTSYVAKHFNKLQPDYYIKVASDNPMNPKNLPEPLESELLNRFRADTKLDNIVEQGIIKNQTFLVSSRPSKATEDCMICHGDPQKAPSAITQAYGTAQGYNYKPGSVVGTMVVGVPLKNIMALVLERSLIVFGGLTLLFGILFIAVNNLVKRQIIQPVVDITDFAIAISKGELDRQFDVKRDGSEIGELNNAINMLKRSLVYATQRLQQQ